MASRGRAWGAATLAFSIQGQGDTAAVVAFLAGLAGDRLARALRTLLLGWERGAEGGHQRAGCWAGRGACQEKARACGSVPIQTEGTRVADPRQKKKRGSRRVGPCCACPAGSAVPHPRSRARPRLSHTPRSPRRTDAARARACCGRDERTVAVPEALAGTRMVGRGAGGAGGSRSSTTGQLSSLVPHRRSQRRRLQAAATSRTKKSKDGGRRGGTTTPGQTPCCRGRQLLAWSSCCSASGTTRGSSRSGPGCP